MKFPDCFFKLSERQELTIHLLNIKHTYCVSNTMTYPHDTLLYIIQHYYCILKGRDVFLFDVDVLKENGII